MSLYPKSMKHVIVYSDKQYYAGWPFNGGFWQFSDGELAVGFVRGRFDYSTEKISHEKVDRDRGEHVILRSNDGGITWPADTMTTVYTRPDWDGKIADPAVNGQKEQTGCDPRTDGYCLISGYGIPAEDAQNIAFATVSTDRGRTWSDPVRVPDLGRFLHLGGRPSYVVRDDGLLLLTIHGSFADISEERSFPLVFASADGGQTWRFLAEIELKPAKPMGIMPFPLILSDGRILAAVRRQYDFANAFTQIYESGDGGRTWRFCSRVNDWGAPASLTELKDGRLVCTYGYRQVPWGIRAAVSADGGRTWGREIILRDDGGTPDLGYPRTLLRPDGSMITVYYYNTGEDPVPAGGGVRHIAATIWEV